MARRWLNTAAMKSRQLSVQFRTLRAMLSSTAVAVALLCQPAASDAQERLCDPAFEDCRAPLLDLIRAETVGIDVAFWFMEDGRYANELIAKFQQGVRVRVLVDPRANGEHPVNAQIVDQLAAAGIPMRRRSASGILHWKMMLFAGQRTVQFSGANYSPHAFRPDVPFANYTDEAIFFTADAAIVESFMRRFDDLWTNTSAYTDYSNMTGQRTRRYPLHAIHPDLNFPPSQSFRNRAVARYDAEASAIDVTMYRITDARHTDAIIAAVARGVPVRLITAPEQYRDPTRLWHSWNVDRLYMAGVQVRHSAHQGLNHQKSVQLRGQGMTIFGSSNWTSPSTNSQEEHNYFTTKPSIMQWFTDQFERKWNNLAGAETQPFQPLPPDPPVYSPPISVGAPRARRLALVFDGGPFAHLYDIYFGKTADPPLFAANVPLGPREPGRSLLRYVLPPLVPNTTYYWRIVSRTIALQEAAGPVASFTTGPNAAPLMPTDFNVDGRGDLAWRHSTTGAVSLWLMDGLAVADTAALSSRSPVFRIVGVGDLDGDARSDLVWRHSLTGDVSTSLMTSATSSRLVNLASGVPLEWQVAGVADINADARADLIWRHSQTGDVSVWLMDGGTLVQGVVIMPGVPFDWHIAGLGDVDGDLRSDIIWRNLVTGHVSVWFLDGAAIKSWAVVPAAVDTAWSIARVGDLDGDRKTDVVWRQTQTGDVAVWLMDSATVKAGAIVAFGIPPNWQIAASADYDGDGRVDLMWRDTVGGDVAVWLMNGAAIGPAALVWPGVALEWQVQR
jgi:phosphatidylserine/phosphatidylglycerophosphate/cardiolipin synthase-like enzyme